LISSSFARSASVSAAATGQSLLALSVRSSIRLIAAAPGQKSGRLSFYTKPLPHQANGRDAGWQTRYYGANAISGIARAKAAK